MCKSNGNESPVDLLLKLYPFKLDGVFCRSLASFLEAVKFSEITTQEFVCAIGSETDLQRISSISSGWRERQELYWRGRSFPRRSKQYQELISEAFSATCLYPESQDVVLSITDAMLGRVSMITDPSATVLTKRELTVLILQTKEMLHAFCRRAMVMPVQEHVVQ